LRDVVTTTPHNKAKLCFQKYEWTVVLREAAITTGCTYGMKVQSRALNLSAFPGNPEMPTRVTQVAPTTVCRMGNFHLSDELILTMPILQVGLISEKK
jgi:hypothetical protein